MAATGFTSHGTQDMDLYSGFISSDGEEQWHRGASNMHSPRVSVGSIGSLSELKHIPGEGFHRTDNQTMPNNVIINTSSHNNAPDVCFDWSTPKSLGFGSLPGSSFNTRASSGTSFNSRADSISSFNSDFKTIPSFSSLASTQGNTVTRPRALSEPALSDFEQSDQSFVLQGLDGTDLGDVLSDLDVGGSLDLDKSSEEEEEEEPNFTCAHPTRRRTPKPNSQSRQSLAVKVEAQQHPLTVKTEAGQRPVSMVPTDQRQATSRDSHTQSAGAFRCTATEHCNQSFSTRSKLEAHAQQYHSLDATECREHTLRKELQDVEHKHAVLREYSNLLRKLLTSAQVKISATANPFSAIGGRPKRLFRCPRTSSRRAATSRGRGRGCGRGRGGGRGCGTGRGRGCGRSYGSMVRTPCTFGSAELALDEMKESVAPMTLVQEPEAVDKEHGGLAIPQSLEYDDFASLMGEEPLHTDKGRGKKRGRKRGARKEKMSKAKRLASPYYVLESAESSW